MDKYVNIRVSMYTGKHHTYVQIGSSKWKGLQRYIVYGHTASRAQFYGHTASRAQFYWHTANRAQFYGHTANRGRRGMVAIRCMPIELLDLEQTANRAHIAM